MLKILAGGTVGAVLGGLLGYILGVRHGFVQGMQHLETEVASVLALDVEAASCVRTGDTNRALSLLELRIDGGVLSLAAAKTNLGILAAQSSEQPAEVLGLAKVYRSVVPSTGRDAAFVRSALESVPPPQRPSPALRVLAKRAEQ